MRRIAAILAAALLAGCYFDRLTSKFGDMPELGNIEDDAVIAEATTNDADAARIRMRLMELEMEEDPSYRMNAGDQIEIRVYDHPDLSMTTRIGPRLSDRRWIVEWVITCGRTQNMSPA